MPKQHDLKCSTRFFQDVWDRLKTFEIRKDDREFNTGDTLLLREYSLHGGFSNRVIICKVGYKIKHNDFREGIKPGYCVLGLIDNLNVEDFKLF